MILNLILLLIVVKLIDNIGAWFYNGMKRPKWWVVVFALALAPAARAQERVLTLVEMAEPAAHRMAVEYTPYREQLWCVTAYETVDRGEYILLRITGVQPAATLTNEAHHARLSLRECVSPAGVRQPTIHTHSENNCQYSPDDAAAYLMRDAAFDGIQCGTRAKVWYFAWQLHAALGIPAVAKNAGGGK